MEPIEGFGVVMNRRDPSLDEALVAIAHALDPPVDLIEQLARLDDLAATCPTPTAEGVMRHLFRGTEAFEGDRHSYGDPQNSLIHRVLDRRRGLPITLAALAIEVGRRVGVDLAGVGMPAHFLVAELDGPSGRPQRWFDCFDAGRALDEAGCRALYQRVTGDRQHFDLAWLQPVTTRQLVVRVLNNLKSTLQQRDEVERLRTVVRLRMVLPELALLERGELARLMAPFN